MRSWKIIAVSVVASTTVDALSFLPATVPSRTDLLDLLSTRWPALGVVWFGSYGAFALVLTTIAISVEMGRTRGRVLCAAAEHDSGQVSLVDVCPPMRRRSDAVPQPVADRRQPVPWSPVERVITSSSVKYEWLRRYLVQLSVAQYFTAIVGMFGIGLTRVPVGLLPIQPIPSFIANSPTLGGGAVLVLALLPGILLLGVGAGYLARLAIRLAIARPELRILREIVGILRAREVGLRAPNKVDALNALIEPGQRAVLDALKELATSVNRMGQDVRLSLEEIKGALQDRGPNRTAETEAPSGTVGDGAAGSPHAAVLALNDSINRLEEISSLLSLKKTPTAMRAATPLPDGSTASLSTELQDLLRELEEAAQSGQGTPPR